MEACLLAGVVRRHKVLMMRKSPLALWPILLCLNLFLSAGPAVALECGGRFVSSGDRKYEVRSACGKPVLVQKWQEELVVFEPVVEDALEQLRSSRVVNIEEWTYNFGPRRFLYFLRFENGQLTRIDSGPYGFDAASGLIPADPEGCGRFIEPGQRMVEVLRYCGAPVSKDSIEDLRTVSIGDAKTRILQKQKVLVRKEEWVYDFGSSRFVFFVTFENGRVTAVEDRGYGH